SPSSWLPLSVSLVPACLFHVLVLPWSGERRRGLHAAPEIVRKGPEHGGARRPAPRLRAVAHGEVGDQRGAKVDGEAGVRPLLEPPRQRREQHRDADQLGPRVLHPEVVGEAEVGERRRHLRQAQLRGGGEADLQAEQRGDDPETDDGFFRARHGYHLGNSTPNSWAYSAFSRCQPSNFITSMPAMRPRGSPPSG